MRGLNAISIRYNFIQTYQVKLFSIEQIRAWDRYTIAEENIASIQLMERAAAACTGWLASQFAQGTSFVIICGKGNNGGDGLAIARMLVELSFKVSTFIIDDGKGKSADFEINLGRLSQISKEINFILDKKDLPKMDGGVVIIDALFGTGLSKKPAGIYRDVIRHINKSTNCVVAIDMPSGLFADRETVHQEVMKATTTLSFQTYKRAFLMAENSNYCGRIVILDIGLSSKYEHETHAEYELVDMQMVKNRYKKRNEFSHKGDFGYAGLIAGSYGMMGAAVLCSLSCMRSGVGKLTSTIPACGYEIMQSTVPEAMCITSGSRIIKKIKDFEKYDAMGIGPGIGKHLAHRIWLKELFINYQKPIVVDADALNILAETPSLLAKIPAGSIITPHPKEFERLFGVAKNSWDRIDKAKKYSKKWSIFIILKGHHTFIATPEGNCFFNSTGNAGMATAGAGDVLTGIVTALVAQGYSRESACLLGVYLHGLAGDMAARAYTEEAMIASDIIKCLPEGVKEIAGK